MRAGSLTWLAVMLVYLAACWYGMMIVHELGHVIGAWLTGGVVERVELHPLRISRTDLSFNPHPLVVIWSGPILGCAIPLLLWLAMRKFVPAYGFLIRFFAGFCCIANGAYLSVGSIDSIGDAGDLLRHQCPVGYLWLSGFILVPSGFALWNGIGPSFGIIRSNIDGS